MSDSILASFIALSGIVISALISFLVSRRQIDLQMLCCKHEMNMIDLGV
jgi:uncharacterized membrane protein YdjX (TVP38/TMEM64 family)